MINQKCEFCENNAKWKFYKNEYIRYCCEAHIAELRRLIYLDRGLKSYEFEPYPSSEETTTPKIELRNEIAYGVFSYFDFDDCDHDKEIALGCADKILERINGLYVTIGDYKELHRVNMGLLDQIDELKKEEVKK